MNTQNRQSRQHDRPTRAARALSLAAALGASLAYGGQAHAQGNIGAAPIKGLPISHTATKPRLGSMATRTSTRIPTARPCAVGVRYRIRMWVDITGSDDGFADRTLECYGTLYVNGSRWWEIPRNEASRHKRERGQILDVSGDPNSSHFGQAQGRRFLFDQYYSSSLPFVFDLRIRDHDSGSGDDNVGLFRSALNLARVADRGEFTYNWGNPRHEASRLHVRVERVGPI